jgi:hypothetical protein
MNVSHVNYTGDYASLKNAIARVNIYYDDLRYTLIEDSVAINVATLLGTLGGNLELFLGKYTSFSKKSSININAYKYFLKGASVLSMTEPIKFFYFLFKEILKIFLHKCKIKASKNAKKPIIQIQEANMEVETIS